jgi:hypothetical protein
MSRPLSTTDLLWIAAVLGLLNFCLAVEIVSAEVVVISTRRETPQPLPFAPVTVKVSPRSPACDCKDCNCLDGCACGTAHKYVGSVDAGIQCLRCWEVKSDPLHTVGDGGSSPPASLAREGVAQRQSPTTYTAAQGRWVRSCGPNGCSQVWQASQPAALPKARQSVQPQRRGLFGWRR